MTRRPRRVDPPAPSDYGTPDVRWHPSKDHDAVHVAALNLQHLMLCEIRRLVGEAGSAADLSRLLGTSLRTAQRITAGEHLLRLDELVELACLFGDNVLEAIPRTVTELFPEVYRPYLDAWTAGGRALPLFAQPPVPETIAWVDPVADMCHWLADESRTGRMGLVNVWVSAHRLAQCLADAEIPSSLIVAARSDLSGRWLALDVLTRIPTRVLLCYLLDPVDEPVVALRNTLSVFYAALAHEGQRVALLCLGQRMTGQLRVHAPALIAAQPGDTVTIPFQVAGKLGVQAAKQYPAPDLALTVEASAVSNRDAHVLALSVGKAT